MPRPRVLRLLQIAFSAVCGILCMLVIALWVRSYWRYDTLYVVWFQRPAATEGAQRITSMEGWVYIEEKFQVSPNVVLPAPRLTSTLSGGKPVPRGVGSAIPHWAILVAIAFSTTALWIRWKRRFSLRTLLIATTLVAVALGLVVALR